MPRIKASEIAQVYDVNEIDEKAINQWAEVKYKYAQILRDMRSLQSVEDYILKTNNLENGEVININGLKFKAKSFFKKMILTCEED